MLHHPSESIILEPLVAFLVIVNNELRLCSICDVVGGNDDGGGRSGEG